MPKATNAESDKRTTEIFKLLVLGLSRAEILQYCADKRKNSNGELWNVEERQIDTYIKKATKQLRSDASFDRQYELGKAMSRLNGLYQNCLKVQDYKAALAVQREMNTLLGLHAPQQVQHTGAGGGAITLKFEWADMHDNSGHDADNH